MTLPNFAQCSERRFLLACQHQRGIGLDGEFAGLSILAVANRHHARILQVAQKTAVGIVDDVNRYAVTLLARTYQEIGDVGGEPVLFWTVFIPEGKTAVVTLHLQQTRDADLNGRAALLVAVALNTQRA